MSFHYVYVPHVCYFPFQKLTHLQLIGNTWAEIKKNMFDLLLTYIPIYNNKIYKNGSILNFIYGNFENVNS